MSKYKSRIKLKNWIDPCTSGHWSWLLWTKLLLLSGWILTKQSLMDYWAISAKKRLLNFLLKLSLPSNNQIPKSSKDPVLRLSTMKNYLRNLLHNISLSIRGGSNSNMKWSLLSFWYIKACSKYTADPCLKQRWPIWQVKRSILALLMLKFRFTVLSWYRWQLKNVWSSSPCLQIKEIQLLRDFSTPLLVRSSLFTLSTAKTNTDIFSELSSIQV